MEYILQQVNGEILMRDVGDFPCTFENFSLFKSIDPAEKEELNHLYQHIAQITVAAYKRLPHILFADNNQQMLFNKSGMHNSRRSSEHDVQCERVMNNDPPVPVYFPIHPHTYTVIHRIVFYCTYAMRSFSVSADYELIARKDYNMEGLFRRYHIDNFLAENA